MNTTMKAFALLVVVASGAVLQDNTITKVVKLLQGMLDKSVAEGDKERKIFAKFKCYCDQSEAEKTESIENGKETISLLESKIEEIQGDTGGLSSEVADLKQAMADNRAARKEAKTLRDKENKAFKAEKADLEQGIAQMKSAIRTLSAVGADQTKSTGADNKQFMAGKTMLLQQMQTEVGHALRAASALLDPEQQSAATAFLQAPFTGTYTSQSAVVMGIIKNMRDTFEKNLEDAIRTEDDAQVAFEKFTKEKETAHKEMKDSYDEKQKSLGGNDGDLSSKRKQLSDAEKQLDSDEDFLSKLRPLCADKTEAYNNRKVLRANEEAAIAEAISILNSDDAFATFGSTDATSTGKTGFIQLRSVRRHVSGPTAQTVLQKAAAETKSARLSKVVALLQAENPFDGVLEEIDNMLEIIKEEGKADKEKKDWCDKERKENDATVAKKKKEILALNTLINKLDDTINGEKSGLKAQIANTEESLATNTDSQAKQTAQRKEENQDYQQDVQNLQRAQTILTKAIKVLNAYYDDMEKKLADGMNTFVQLNHNVKREDPNAPAGALDDKYAGQSGKGNDVLKMLDFILDETAKEEKTAHSDEETAQGKFEDSMADLKKKEAKDEKRLSDLQESLAGKEKELLDANADLKDTTADKEETEDVLAKIKPGCDFITENIKQRNKNRATESSALKKAINLIKGTPAYKSAKAEAKSEGFGDCADTCGKDENHVECKACMGDVTIPAYCAGHKGTKGC